MHMAAKTDANQSEIVQAMRRMGASVQHTHMIGRGCPDILAGIRGVNLFLEVKDGKKSPSKRRLTPDETEWHDSWRGQVAIVESIDDALALLNSVGHEPDRAALLRTIQARDAEIQRLRAELAKERA